MSDESKLKDSFFASYLSTHHVPRKGQPSRQQLRDLTPRWETLLRRFLPADRDARIIDIGCGYGAVVWWLQEIGYPRAEGIDISAEQVAAAQALGIVNVQAADLRTYLQGRERAYDVIMARDVFEHFDRGSLMSILDSIKAALKDGGLLVFQVPNAESPFGGRIRYGDITHELAFTPSAVSQIMHRLGFSDVRVYPVEPVIFGSKTLLRLMLWKIVQAFYRTLLTIEVGRGDWIVTQNLIAAARR